MDLARRNSLQNQSVRGAPARRVTTGHTPPRAGWAAVSAKGRGLSCEEGGGLWLLPPSTTFAAEMRPSCVGRRHHEARRLSACSNTPTTQTTTTQSTAKRGEQARRGVGGNTMEGGGRGEHTEEGGGKPPCRKGDRIRARRVGGVAGHRGGAQCRATSTAGKVHALNTAHHRLRRRSPRPPHSSHPGGEAPRHHLGGGKNSHTTRSRRRQAASPNRSDGELSREQMRRGEAEKLAPA